jgi:hypothetical protein
MPTSPEAVGEHAEALRKAADAYDIQYFNLDTQARASFQAQERALAIYGVTRSDTRAAEAADVHYITLLRWKRDNYLRYRDRLAAAHTSFVSSLERTMWDRIDDPTGNRGSDILLMFALKAHAPKTYRELPAMDDETAKETLAQLRKLSRQAHKGKAPT